MLFTLCIVGTTVSLGRAAIVQAQGGPIPGAALGPNGVEQSIATMQAAADSARESHTLMRSEAIGEAAATDSLVGGAVNAVDVERRQYPPQQRSGGGGYSGGQPGAMGNALSPGSQYQSPRLGAQVSGGPPPGGCVIPMWDAKTYVCVEAGKADAEWEDESSVTRKAFEDRGTCTVTCPSWWQSPDVRSMVCKSGRFKTDAGDKAAGISCKTSNRIYLGVFVVGLIVALAIFYYRRRQQLQSLEKMHFEDASVPHDDSHHHGAPDAAHSNQAGGVHGH